MVRAKLPAAAAELRGQVNEFATLRAQQLDSWAPDPTPTFKDAARHLGVIAENVAVEGRKIAGIVAIEGRKYASQAADEGLKRSAVSWRAGGSGSATTPSHRVPTAPGEVSRSRSPKTLSSVLDGGGGGRRRGLQGGRYRVPT